MGARNERGAVSVGMIGAVLAIIILAGVFYRLGTGERAQRDLQTAHDTIDLMVEAAEKAKQERDALDAKYGTINAALEERLNENAARTARNRASIQSAVAADPALRNARVSPAFVGMYNGAGTAGRDGNATEPARRAGNQPARRPSGTRG